MQERGQNEMKIIGMIPARYQSTRFPGKPLADVCGKPMIWRVYEQCMKVRDFSSVYVVTDDERIMSVCQELNMRAVRTSDQHKTGTDRIGEAARDMSADLIVNIQGDEPLLEPDTIRAAIVPFYENPDLQVSNLMARIKNPADVVNVNIPKVITNKEGIGVYLTRATAPYPKGNADYSFYKQVCVYGFRPEALRFYCDYGIRFGKAKVEAAEDIEILRLIENGYKVQYVEVDTDTIAVDTQEDLYRVRKCFLQKKLRGGGKQIL